MIKIRRKTKKKRKKKRVVIKAPEPVLLDIPPPKGENIIKRDPRKRHEISHARFIINFLAKHNPNVKHVRDGLDKLSREDLADRMCLIYCEILGLSGTETM